MLHSPDKLLGKEEEGLLVVVVALRGDLVVLQVLLPARKRSWFQSLSTCSLLLHTSVK